MLKLSTQILLSHIRRGQVLSSTAVLQRKNQQQSMRLHSSDTDDISYNLTKHEAITYLENVLGIPDPASYVKKDKMAFIQEMMRQTKWKIPFTNIAGFREDGEKGPTLDEFKQAFFKHEGGSCIPMNSFTSEVLQCLGFDTYIIGASIHRWKIPLYDNHFALVAKHLTNPDSLHLVDVGSQYFLPPISLDFDRTSQVYDIRSLQYRFFQVSPGVIQLTRKCESPKPGQGDGLIYIENDECWEVLTTFKTLSPWKMAECVNQNDEMREKGELAPGFWDDFVLISYPNNLFINITNKRCLAVTETGHAEETQMKNSTQVVDTILKYFPQYSRSRLESMADYFAKKSQKKSML